ncbi:hypothetical protein L6452_32364 [Arctium lappa]|uniref:Uncharacterized protein n=1 Tax=Arctium lappa TaxID=4217 RepID=A0ACB8Z4T3_ARCLA|nr:hypothetical protein L6452_32364 [Arctium lappa]
MFSLQVLFLFPRPAARLMFPPIIHSPNPRWQFTNHLLRTTIQALSVMIRDSNPSSPYNYASFDSCFHLHLLLFRFYTAHFRCVICFRCIFYYPGIWVSRPYIQFRICTWLLPQSMHRESCLW